jgi:hypothetical protein
MDIAVSFTIAKVFQSKFSLHWGHGWKKVAKIQMP